MGTQDCDVTLKTLIAEAGEDVLNDLAGAGRVKAWLNVELPRVRNPRIDLLGTLESGRLIHVELQSSNDMTIQRMLEYGTGIWRQEGSFPRQLLFYVGNEPLRIVNQIETEDLSYRFPIIDFRELDGDALRQKGSLALCILSILAGSQDLTVAMREIIMRIAELEPAARADALQKLMILAGMRGVARRVEEEMRNMPVTFDIMDNEVLGPAIRKGIEEGRSLGEKQVLRLQLEKRFGPLPGWIGERLAGCSIQEVEDLAVRFVDAQSLDDLFAERG